MKATIGLKIVCSSGHVCGALARDVREGVVIAPQDFDIMTGISVQNGYVCDRCRSPVATIETGRWRISTELGWLN